MKHIEQVIASNTKLAIARSTKNPPWNPPCTLCRERTNHPHDHPPDLVPESPPDTELPRPAEQLPELTKFACALVAGEVNTENFPAGHQHLREAVMYGNNMRERLLECIQYIRANSGDPTMVTYVDEYVEEVFGLGLGLEKPCPKCNGTMYITNPDNPEGAKICCDDCIPF